MATFSKYGEGWRAQVARRGVRKSATFPSKGAAVAWAGQVEAEIMAGYRGEIPNLMVKALLERYEREVTPGKKGKRWEAIRLQALGRDRIAQVRLRLLDSPHVADWQTRRLKAVASGSVRRERNLLNNVFEIARKEWKWLGKNPFEGVRRPKDGKPRNRVASDAELALLTAEKDDLARAVTVAVETAMRAGEIASKPPIQGRIATLGDSKNGHGRDIPLSGLALEAFNGGIHLTAGSISALFARRCKKKKIRGLTFHDLKHTAMTRLSKKLNPWELAKMTGNKDMNLLLRVYYHHDPEETAKKL
jgi:integrase